MKLAGQKGVGRYDMPTDNDVISNLHSVGD